MAVLSASIASFKLSDTRFASPPRWSAAADATATLSWARRTREIPLAITAVEEAAARAKEAALVSMVGGWSQLCADVGADACAPDLVVLEAKLELARAATHVAASQADNARATHATACGALELACKDVHEMSLAAQIPAQEVGREACAARARSAAADVLLSFLR